MKKIILIMTVMICGCLFTTSCDKEEEEEVLHTGGPYPRDTSLAGSVSFTPSQYIIEAEGVYGKTILKDLESNESILDTDKVSDTEIALDCQIIWGETIFNISIPKIPLAGVAYDATFDYKSEAATVTYNDNKYAAVSTSIKGWIKEVPMKANKSSTKNISKEIAPNFYECEININCTIDGKPLSLKITEIDPYGKQ